MTTHSFPSQPTVPASPGSEAAPALRIAAPPHPVLVDDPRGVIISGCEPCSPVVVHARVEIDNATREASATFRADETGTVETSRDASLAGTYTGVDPFGLWWSGDPVAPSASSSPSPVSARLHVEAGGHTAETTTERLWLAPGATVSEIREPGVWGLFARPAGPGPFPAVIAFAARAAGLARRRRGHRRLPRTASPRCRSPTSVSLAFPKPWSASTSRPSGGRRTGCSGGPTWTPARSLSWACRGAASSPCSPERSWSPSARSWRSRPAGFAGPGSVLTALSPRRHGGSAVTTSPAPAFTRWAPTSGGRPRIPDRPEAVLRGHAPRP